MIWERRRTQWNPRGQTEPHVSFSRFLDNAVYLQDPSSTVCFSFSARIIAGSMSGKKSKAVLNNHNPPAGLPDVYLFSGAAASTSSSSLSGTRWETLISTNCLLLIPSVWCLLALEFLQDLCLERPLSLRFCCCCCFGHILNLFYEFLD